jgi:uncharacterized protein YcgL (UPF0745 family)
MAFLKEAYDVREMLCYVYKPCYTRESKTWLYVRLLYCYGFLPVVILNQVFGATV